MPTALDTDTHPWTQRLALAALIAAVPLLAFGGSVTTLGAGMAVEGWLIAEGHFLLVFPVEKWFRDLPTFIEHTHRLFGSLVGLLSLATVVSTWLVRTRSELRLFAGMAFAAVCVQGLLGGMRVLEDSPSFAFVHGVIAQLTFCALALVALSASAVFASARRRVAGLAETRVLGRAALSLAVALVVQITLGAWYRHGLRPAPLDGSLLRLQLHLFGALVAFGLAMALATRLDALRQAAGSTGAASRVASGLRRALVHGLGLQFLLGGLAWVGFEPGRVGAIEWACSVLHVLGGALLLSVAAGSWLLSRPVVAPEPATEPVSSTGGLA